MLTNAPLRRKLLLILLFPLLGFLVLAGLFLNDNLRTLRDMQATVSASGTAQSISQLITRLQRERGASGVFIRSLGKNRAIALGSFARTAALHWKHCATCRKNPLS